MVPGTLKLQHCFFLLFVLTDNYLIFTRVFPLVGRNKYWGASDQSLEHCAAAIEFCVKSADMMMAARNSQPFCLLPQHSKLQREMMKVNIWAICSGLSLDSIPVRVHKSVGWMVISAGKSWKMHFCIVFVSILLAEHWLYLSRITNQIFQRCWCQFTCLSSLSW